MKNKENSMDKYKELREKFIEGDWVIGVNKHTGCSPVFDHDKPNIQPFSYLGETDSNEFRLATTEEIDVAKSAQQIKSIIT